MQEAQIGVRLVGEKRREKIGRHVERRRESRQNAVAHRAERAKIRHHVAPHLCHAGDRLGRPLVAPAQRFAGDHVGMVGAAVVADEKALVLVRPCRLVHGRGALHRGVDRQIADIVLVEPELQLFLERQRVKAARGGKGALDQLFRHAVVGRIEKPDILARMADLRRQAASAPGSPANSGPKSMTGICDAAASWILDAEFLEQIHRRLLPRAAHYSPPARPAVLFLLFLRGITAMPGVAAGRHRHCDRPRVPRDAAILTACGG